MTLIRRYTAEMKEEDVYFKIILKYVFRLGYTYICFKIISVLKSWCASRKQRTEQITLFHYFKSNALRNFFNLSLTDKVFLLVSISFVLVTCSIFGFSELFNFFLSFTILCIAEFFIFNSPEIDNVLESNNLNIGYGAAMAYYKNYLNFFLPYKFITHIEEFKTRHQVDVQSKLYILVPLSCKIPMLLETPDSELIERCRELKEHNETHAGFKDRTYTITVYQVRNQNHSLSIRLAVEYAQPLKALFALKEKELISTEEMFHQRDMFIQALHDFLKDENDSYKFCKLIDYDDEVKEVHDALLEQLSAH